MHQDACRAPGALITGSAPMRRERWERRMSIVQRIRLGFTLLLVLLLLLGAISYLKTTSIHGRFQQVTEEATPQALTASRLRAALLMADRDSLAHLAIRETSAFPQSRQRFVNDKARYEQHIK